MTVEAARVLLEAMRVIIEAVRLFVEAVRMLVEAVRVLKSLANNISQFLYFGKIFLVLDSNL